MNEQELYKLLLAEEGFKNSISAIEKNTNNECLRISLTSISLSRRRKYSNAKRLISRIDERKCDSFSRSVYLEAMMLNSLYDKASLEKVEEIADKVLSINPKAAYARLIKSQVAINHGNIESGIGFILSIGEDYPNVKWIYFVLVRLLAFAKEYKEAQKYVDKVETTFRRTLYNILVKVLLPLPNKILWLFVFLILFVGFNSLLSYWFLLFMIPLLVFVFYGIIKKDRLIYAGFFSTSIIIFLFFILISALK